MNEFGENYLPQVMVIKVNNSSRGDIVGDFFETFIKKLIIKN